ncbi:PaaI family thioesterase [Psychromarinibacter sp. C21-152]|uniref:PaaI family thioesterase n=1 Tax=Psychromarinibacter sediminicola TaxID=3033385 RepID=A0AAE3NST9_9RHOB|nr:PaaI family thioesterase [Psychromarinibacter sediminicola]MDF0603633.1 PaaI family thioesterase [Psychromarinibacter sediminicola]
MYVAETPDQLASFEELTSMSGLDFMLGMFEGRIAGPPIAEAMNYWLEAVEEGRVVFRGAPQFRDSNPMGSVHGGWYGTLLDSCMACAVMTRVPKGWVYTTLEYKVNIVRPIPLETEILAEGVVQHAGRSTGIARGEIVGAEDGRVYATGSTTCIILKPGAR